MSLDDLLRGQSVVLVKSITRQILPDKFVGFSLGIAAGCVARYQLEHKGVFDIDGVVETIRQYEYDERAHNILTKYGIIKRDAIRHLELARWYSEFFVKYAVVEQMQGAQHFIEPIIQAMASGDCLTLRETVETFNSSVRQSGIENPEKYFVPMPSLDVQRYYLNGPHIKQKPAGVR